MVKIVPEITHEIVKHADHVEYQFTYSGKLGQTQGSGNAAGDQETLIIADESGFSFAEGTYQKGNRFQFNQSGWVFQPWLNLSEFKSDFGFSSLMKSVEGLKHIFYDNPGGANLFLDNDPGEWFFSLSLSPNQNLTPAEISEISEALFMMWQGDADQQRARVEAEVLDVIEQIEENKDLKGPAYTVVAGNEVRVIDNKTFTFRGKTYRVGFENVNSVLNAALLEVDSKMRIALAPNSQGQVQVVYGRLKAEGYTTTQEGFQENFVSFGKIERVVNGNPNNLAFNDGFGSLFVLSENISSKIDSRARNPVKPTYKAGVYEKIHQVFLKNQDAVEAYIQEFLLYHEIGHSKFHRSQDVEHKYILREIGAVKERGPITDGDGTLQVLHELSADVNALKQLVRMGRNPDANQQKKAAVILIGVIVMYGFQNSVRNSLDQGSREMTTLLLLDCVSFDEAGKLKVDWLRLSATVESLDKILKIHFDNLRLRYQQMAIATHPDAFGDQALSTQEVISLHLKDIEPLYDDLVEQKLEEIRIKYPDLTDDQRERHARNELVIETLNAETPADFGRPVAPRVDLLLMQEHLARYRLFLDQWFEVNLEGLEARPFRYFGPQE